MQLLLGTCPNDYTEIRSKCFHKQNSRSDYYENQGYCDTVSGTLASGITDDDLDWLLGIEGSFE